jgi:FlaG/FlaF family flagellin (archaellin)
MKIKKLNRAVSEIIGAMLLLLIVISVFSLIYFQVLSDEGPENKTIVKIGGRIEGTNVVLEHQGGEPLELDTEISITIGGIKYKGPVGNWLDDKNDDGVWNIGERMLFSFEYNLSRLGEYQEVDITAVDTQSDSVIFMGPIDLKPVSDIGIELTIDNLYPKIGEHINITITVTCYGGDVDGAGNVEIKYLVPEGLIYDSSIAGQGTYDNETGIWDVGNVLVGQPATIRIEVKVVGIVTHEFTQLAMVLDGSDSTNPNKWNLMKEGLKKAIKDETVFPHDGSVELTVIEYGSELPPCANAELLPTVITEDNYADIAQDLRNTAYPGGHAPMGCGLRLGADLVHDVGNFSSDIRQIIILVTEGNPDCLWIPGTYNATYENYTVGKSSAEDAREYLNTTLNLQEDQDELDVIVVGNDVNIDWLNNSIAWPQPGYEAPPINGSGWVNYVTDWQEFEDAISMTLKILLNSITIRVELAGSTTIDPYIENDNVVMLISPQI